MDTSSIIIGSLFIATALFIIGLAVPLLKGNVKPNRLYGARFQESFTSEEAWYEINCYAARQLIGWSIPMLLIGIAVLFMPLEKNTALTIGVLVTPFLLIVGAIQTKMYARRVVAQESKQNH